MDEKHSKLDDKSCRINESISESKSTICDSILNANSNRNSNSLKARDSSKDWPSFRDYQMNKMNWESRERSQSISQNWDKRPITNNSWIINKTNSSSYGSLPDDSIFYKFDASLQLDFQRNINLDVMNPSETNIFNNLQKNNHLVDVDQEKLCDLARDIINSSRNEDNKEVNTKKPVSVPNLGFRAETTTKSDLMDNTFSLLTNAPSELKNRCQIEANLFHNKLALNGSVDCSLYFNDPIWTRDLPNIWNDIPDRITQMALKLRNVAKKVDASYTWSGQLPKRNRNKNPIYSCKVFLGGIPYDLTDTDLHMDFAKFGPIQIQWPGVNVKSAIEGAAANKAGYVYVVFESYDNVTALLNACTVSYKDLDSGCRWYFNMNSRRTKMKEVQVIPFDIGDRFYMKGTFSGQMEHSKTVFVGALHGMLSADGLAKVMEDLFGGVIFAGLDTDKHKYPLGSGRVSFDNNESYLKAVNAAFVEIKSSRFKKKIQIDPYIENESICGICKVSQQSPVFCRDMACFQYYCRNCWDVKHSDPEFHNHRPIIKNKPN